MVLVPVKVGPASIKAPPKIVESPNVAVPTGWDGEGVVEAPSTLTATAEFTVIGQYVQGIYRGQHVGPNGPVYEIEIESPDDPRKSEIIGVWGSTILDERMRRLAPKDGQAILIQYLGTTPTKKGMNPAKVFRVRKSG